MATDKHEPGKSPNPARRGRASAHAENKPEWADGLRALYEAVVEEPLPDSFKDLLNRLDDPSANGSS